MYVYLKTDRGVWEAGFYSPKGKFVSESLWNNLKDAAQRVNWLNGGTPPVLNIPTTITIDDEALAEISKRPIGIIRKESEENYD